MDLNDDLGFTLPPEQQNTPQAKQSTKQKVVQALLDALNTGVFSYGQGLQAQAQYPGRRGAAAGFGAALNAPVILQQQQQQQRQQQLENQLKIQQLREQALRGNQQAVIQLAQAMRENPPMAQETPATPVMPSDYGGGGAGLQPPPIEQPIQPLKFPLGNGQFRDIPITSQQTTARQALQRVIDQTTAQEAIKQQFAKPQMDVKPFGPDSSGLFESTSGIIIQQPTAGKATATTYAPENVMLDGKPAHVLRTNTGDYVDANTKQPITGRITPYVAPPTPRQKGEITPTAEAGLITNLNGQWERASKDVQALYRANAIMDAGIAAAERGDMNAGSQAVLVTFQKFLDPTSVVRESEYARSGAGLAMADRVRGYLDRLQQGGAGVPLDELKKFAQVGKEINAKLAAEGQSLLSSEKSRISGIASRYGIPQELVIPNYNYAAPTTPTTPTPPATPAPSTQPKAALPKPGEVRNGYRFKGGNPNDQKNWIKVP